MSNRIDEFLNRLLPYPSGPRLLELRRELENHLLDCMEEQLDEGLSEEQAFQAAVQTLGPTRKLKRHIRRIRRNGKTKRPVLVLAGLGLLVLYPLILFLFFRDIDFSLAALLPVLVGGGMLAGVGYRTSMELLLNKYEPLEEKETREFSALFGNGLKHKE